MADDGDHEGSRAIGPLDVHGDAEADVLVVDDARGALLIHGVDVGRVERGNSLESSKHGEGDHVGERDLGTGRSREVLVDHRPVDLEQTGRDGPHAGRRRDREARGHVGRDQQRRAPKGHGVLGPRRSCSSGRRWRGGGSLHALVVAEELPPAHRDRARVREVALVEVLDEPRIRAEMARRAPWRGLGGPPAGSAWRQTNCRGLAHWSGAVCDVASRSRVRRRLVASAGLRRHAGPRRGLEVGSRP